MITPEKGSGNSNLVDFTAAGRSGWRGRAQAASEASAARDDAKRDSVKALDERVKEQGGKPSV